MHRKGSTGHALHGVLLLLLAACSDSGSGELAVLAPDCSRDVAGPDANRNGVRDDIEGWIFDRQVTDSQRKALMQKARALQMTLLIDPRDKAALDHGSDQLMAAAKCGGDTFFPRAEFYRFSGQIEAMTANTRERAARYRQFSTAASGSSMSFPEGDTCEP